MILGTSFLRSFGGCLLSVQLMFAGGMAFAAEETAGVEEVPENETRLDPSEWLRPVPEDLHELREAPVNGLLYERWEGAPGPMIRDLLASPVFRKAPETRGLAGLLELPAGDGRDFGVRMRGHLTAPKSGKVRFVLTSDDNSELWLSPDESPFTRRKVAWITGPGPFGATAPERYDRVPSQWSDFIELEKGKSYYLEAWHKEGGGDDHFSLRWQFTAVPDRAIKLGKAEDIVAYKSTPAS